MDDPNEGGGRGAGEAPRRVSAFSSLAGRRPSVPDRQAGNAMLSKPLPLEAKVAAASRVSFEDLAKRSVPTGGKPAVVQQDPQWPDDHRPAGSRYSVEQWECARDGGRYYVVEVWSELESGLVQFPRPPDPPLVQVFIDGKPRLVPDPSHVSDGGMDWTTAQLFDGCLLLGPKAETLYPGAISNRLTVTTDEFRGLPYRIIRPRIHDVERPLMRHVTGSYSFMEGASASGEEIDESMNDRRQRFSDH